MSTDRARSASGAAAPWWRRATLSLVLMGFFAAGSLTWDRLRHLADARPAPTADTPAAGDGAASPWNASYFPNPVLTDQHGRKHRFYDDLLAGKSVAINTFFTVCSDICPLGTAKMLELQRLMGPRMGREIHFYSLSVDPLGDSPEAMAAYARRYGVGPGWLFLTGSEADIRLIARKLGLGALQQTDARESHSSTMSVGHVPSGRWMKSTSTDNPQFLASHMATFLGWDTQTASAGQAQARTLAIGDGEFLFRNGCAACHEIGGGNKLGPDLLGVSQRRDPQWLRRFIREPDRMFTEGDAQALKLLHDYQGLRMPNLGLSTAEVAAIVGYIDARSERVRFMATGAAAR